MVYTNPSDKEMRVLVVYIDPNTATVVQTKLKASQIRKWIQQPDEVTQVADNNGTRKRLRDEERSCATVRSHFLKTTLRNRSRSGHW